MLDEQSPDRIYNVPCRGCCVSGTRTHFRDNDYQGDESCVFTTAARERAVEEACTGRGCVMVAGLMLGTAPLISRAGIHHLQYTDDCVTALLAS